ncbi:MAG: hypothetical protein ACTSYX_11770 [Candidatus Thorarchaeota archaeon]
MPKVNLEVEGSGSLRDRFYSTYIPAINELLAPGRENRNAEALAKLRFEAICEPPSESAAWPFDPDIEALGSVKKALSSLAALRTALQKTKRDLTSVIRALRRKYRTASIKEEGTVYTAELNFKSYLRSVNALIKTLDILGGKSPGKRFDEADQEIYQFHAEQIKLLIQIRDSTHRRKVAQKKAGERLGLQPSASVKPTRDDSVEAEIELDGVTYAAIDTLNAFLEQTNANYRLGYSPAFPSDTWLKRRQVDGIRADLYFRHYFEPFINEYLCSPKLPFKLGVCENCFIIYMKKDKDTVSWLCPTCRNMRPEDRDTS